jgi:tRNA nucleotidyltransferase/poly(A) polymerase
VNKLYEEAKTILDLFHKRGYEAYYIGGKCRNELHSKYHPDAKVEVKDIDIITNATVDEILTIFPNAGLRGESFQVAVVEFGGCEFEIATYRKDIYDEAELKASNKIVKPQTTVATKLDDDRERRDFTINAIAQDVDNNYIDYIYTYRNKKISSMQDIKDGVIRAIGNPKLRFEEDPLRILRAFRFMAQLGYVIEKQTLKTIESNLKLLEKIPHERISGEFNKILLGRFAAETLALMKSIGVFKIKVFNSIQNASASLLPGLNDIDDQYFYNLNKYNSKMNEKQLPSVIELWAILLKPLGHEQARTNLETIYPLSLNDIEKIEWMIQYWSIIDSTDIKNDIFKARTGIVNRYKLMCMRELQTLMQDPCNLTWYRVR